MRYRTFRRLLPPRPFIDTILRRALILWVFLHVFGGVAAGATGAPPDEAAVGSLVGAGWILAAVVLVSWVDMWRRSESLSLANLGYSFRRIALILSLECGLLELSLRLAVG